MSRLASHEVLSGLFDASAEEIQNCMSSDYNEEDLLIASRIRGLQEEVHEQNNRSVSRGKYHSSELYPATESLLDSEESNDNYEILRKKEKHLLLDQVLPDMWSWHFIGLYSQYAAVGLLYGMVGTFVPFCSYVYDGPTNVCANAKNIVFFAWSLKLFYAILTDSFRPFGLRRKPWMIVGWGMVLLMLLVLAIFADQMSVSVWLVSLLSVQIFLLLSDVPADGYSVELGQLESKEQRGQILATGQRIRFTFCVVAGMIQTFLLNGPDTNDEDCEISLWECWSWGLSVNQYYGLILVLVFILTLPVLWLKEIDPTHVPRHDCYHFFYGIWDTLQNPTTFYLLIFVIGIQGLTNFTSNANISLQYYVIKLTNFQAGIDTVTTYGALVLAIWLFQKYLINRNWRHTQYGSNFFAAALGLLWFPAYYNIGGLMNGWYTIFIDLDTYFVQGLTQVLYSMAVIELARPGQEATTYELIVTVGIAAQTLNGIVSTQLLTPMDSVGCDDDYGNCPSNTVVVTGPDAFRDSDGPQRFTNYTFLLTGIAIGATLLFTPFLPRSKEECHEWKVIGQQSGNSKSRGLLALAIAVITFAYGLVCAILLVDVDTACEPAIGGSGC